MTNLKKLRKQTGLSQSQLAKKTGLNLRTLQFYEQGFRLLSNANVLTVAKIAIALNCDLSDLIDDPVHALLLETYEKSRKT